MSSGRSRKRKGHDAGVSASRSSSKTAKTRKTTVYDAAFEQNLIDHGIYPHGYESDDEERSIYPENWDQINARISRPRPSLSPSRFPRESFRKFEKANIHAHTEDDVKATVLPTIIGDKAIPASRNVEFDNLAPLTDGNISNDKPGYYEGSRPADLRLQVRKDLGKYIVPSTDASRPCLPNFFTEVKGPDGSAKVLKRQACYAGSVGARARHELRSYVDHATALDENAYTVAWTYDSGAGTLISYATHPAASEDPERTIDFRMTQLNSYAVTGNPETFRQGASAFRNSRDWAEETRKRLIDSANTMNQPEPQPHPATSEQSAGIVPSQPTVQPSGGSDAALDVLAVGGDLSFGSLDAQVI